MWLINYIRTMGEIHKRLVIYRTGNDKRPFIEWIDSLKDSKARGIIKNRLENGVYGDCEPVGEGVKEFTNSFRAGLQNLFWRGRSHNRRHTVWRAEKFPAERYSGGQKLLG